MEWPVGGTSFRGMGPSVGATDRCSCWLTDTRHCKAEWYVIDKSGQWWKGDDVEDLKLMVLAWSAGNCRVDEFRQSFCAICGKVTFKIWLDDDYGCAQRICSECDATALICDSADWWQDAAPEQAACPCGEEKFEVVVGFSLIDSGEVRWITVGARCVGCNILGVYTDWKIDYEPSSHLLDMT